MILVPRDLLARINLDALYPPFLERALALVADCRAVGADYFAISGMRTYAEQQALYDQGRVTPGKRVTCANAGESAHNFGLAMDFCRDGVMDRHGLQPDWAPESYAVLGEKASMHGLAWGGVFKSPDRPHIQWPGYVTGIQLAPVREAYESGGITSAWKYVDEH